MNTVRKNEKWIENAVAFGVELLQDMPFSQASNLPCLSLVDEKGKGPTTKNVWFHSFIVLFIGSNSVSRLRITCSKFVMPNRYSNSQIRGNLS
ncbi:hypothetical protein HZ326_17011 [Fusarium oxysporum f. sp. albedinis]|nr:hypothetical protein HZ326_17011 [Fusarium oxysporum f. sp. albedinis]